MASVNRFGGYDYDNHGAILETDAENLTAKIGQSDAAGRDGGFAARGFRNAVDFTIGGILQATGTVDIREIWRDFVAQHNSYAPQALQIDPFGSRYLYAQCIAIREVQQTPAYLNARGFEIDFYCPDPFFYSAANKSAALGTAGVSILSVGGSAYAAPAITLVIGTVSAGVSLPGTAVLIDDFGEAFYLGISSWPGTVTIDSRQGLVTYPGTAPYEQWDGVFPLMNPGSAALSLQPGPVGITQAQATWTDRD